MAPSLPQILLIVVIVLLIFGAKRIPEIARALGRASNEFKRAKDDLETESQKIISGETAAEPADAPKKKGKKKKKKSGKKSEKTADAE